MVGNLSTVTEAPARTSAPSVGKQGAPALPGGGNEELPAGQSLPPKAHVAAPDIAGAVRKLNELMNARQRDLAFRVDEEIGRTVITVLDATTKEVIRQIPSEEVIAMSRALETATGGLFDARI
jgi:flagellar protein FlaG